MSARGKKSFDPELSSTYLRHIHKFDYLESEEEFVLAKEWREKMDPKALHRLVGSHLRLVKKIAEGYRGYGLSMADIISEGHVGMMQALRKFDPEKGFRLSTYAIWWVKAHIQQFILNSWSLVRVGTTPQQRKLFFNLRRIKQKLGVTENTDIDSQVKQSIAKELCVSEKDIDEMNARLSQPDHSLNVPTSSEGEGEGEWQDMIIDESTNHEAHFLYQDELKKRQKILSEALQALNSRERDVFQSRRLKEPPETLENLSQTFGISRERVRQIEFRAFEKLQQAVLSHPLCVKDSQTYAMKVMVGITILGLSGKYFPSMILILIRS